MQSFKISKFTNEKFENRYTYFPKLSNISILRYENNIVQGCPHVFLYALKHFGDKDGVRWSRFNPFLSLNKCFEQYCNRSGIIHSQFSHIYFKKPRTNKNTTFIVAVFLSLLDTFLGSNEAYHELFDNYHKRSMSVRKTMSKSQYVPSRTFVNVNNAKEINHFHLVYISRLRPCRHSIWQMRASWLLAC